MTRPPGLPAELLAMCRREATLGPLAEALRARGVRVDIATGLDDLRDAFFQSGGHGALVLAADLAPGVARAAARSLLDIDPDLRVVAFGDALARAALPRGVTVLTAHHPASRAGIGAVVRTLLAP